MADNFQRTGSISNAHVGRDFESVAIDVLASNGIHVQSNYAVKVGVGEKKKLHAFDLGSENPPVLVECKSHRWTSGSNVPSAKMTVWNEAMYYFHCAPTGYRKILFVLHDVRPSNGETLTGYYLRTYGHLIPDDVEIWEFDPDTGAYEILHSEGNSTVKSALKVPAKTKATTGANEKANPKVGTADVIRSYVNRVFIEPARLSGRSAVRVKAGDVHRDMALVNRIPAVCSALDAGKFQEEYRVLTSRREGPKNGSTVSWTFSIKR